MSERATGTMLDHAIDSPWTAWYDKKKKPIVDYAIDEYKKVFNRARPDWAKSFSERRIYKEQVDRSRYKESFVIPEDSRSIQIYFMEREIYLASKKKGFDVIIERIFDGHGRCNRISKIQLPKGSVGVFKIEQEDKIEKQWHCTENYIIDDIWTHTRPIKLLRLEKPWFNYF